MFYHSLKLSKDECALLFYENIFSKELYILIKNKVSKEIQNFMDKEYERFIKYESTLKFVNLITNSHLSPVDDETFFSTNKKIQPESVSPSTLSG